MKNVRLTVLASLVGIFGLAAGSASATVKDLDAIFGGPLSAFSAPHFGLYNPSVTTEAPTGTFEDWWHFNVAETADLFDSTVFNFNDNHGKASKTTQILGLELELYKHTTGPSITDGETVPVAVGHVVFLEGSVSGTGALDESVSLPNSWKVFAGQDYWLEVEGTVPNTGKITKGAYDLNLALSAVPELSTWAMMIIGFGAVGMQIRRRNSALNAVA